MRRNSLKGLDFAFVLLIHLVLLLDLIDAITSCKECGKEE